MLIEKDLNNKVQPHSVRGGYGEIRVALEDGKIGKTIDNDYAVDDLVPNHLGRPGDSYYNLLHAGESVTPADYLISYGDGTLAKAAAGFLANAVADSTTVTNTVAETTFSTGTAAVPKNTLKVRDLIRVRALVVFPSTNGTDTATLKLKFAGSTILTTAAVDVATNDIGLIDATIVIRTIGAAGTFDAFGTYVLGAPGTAVVRAWNSGSTAIDTTADLTVTLTITWSVANAGNQAILREWLVEDVKAGTAAGAAAPNTGRIFGRPRDTVDNSAGVTPKRIRVRVSG
jgi:hypothetical protein